MNYNIENVLPQDIEKRSFQIIENEIGYHNFKQEQLLIVKRVIHTTADFDYIKNMVFSENAVQNGLNAIQNGASIVTDTHMTKAGINKNLLKKFGGEVFCFMSDEDVAKDAKENKTTRAVASMNKACKLNDDIIFAIGNAPTALLRLAELIDENKINPKLIIGVPVGFVNVIQSKDIILTKNIEYIVAKGRKGGSTVAAAICNALLYML